MKNGGEHKMGNVIQLKRPTELNPVQQIEQRLERIESLLDELRKLNNPEKEI